MADSESGESGGNRGGGGDRSDRGGGGDRGSSDNNSSDNNGSRDDGAGFAFNGAKDSQAANVALGIDSAYTGSLAVGTPASSNLSRGFAIASGALAIATGNPIGMLGGAKSITDAIGSWSVGTPGFAPNFGDISFAGPGVGQNFGGDYSGGGDRVNDGSPTRSGGLVFGATRTVGQNLEKNGAGSPFGRIFVDNRDETGYSDGTKKLLQPQTNLVPTSTITQVSSKKDFDILAVVGIAVGILGLMKNG